MSDTWYRDPFHLPPYPDGLGRTWSFNGELVDGAAPPEPEWPKDWPEDLRFLLFQAEVCFDFAERFRAAIGLPMPND